MVGKKLYILNFITSISYKIGTTKLEEKKIKQFSTILTLDDLLWPRKSFKKLTSTALFWRIIFILLIKNLNSQAGVQKSNPQAGRSPSLATSGKRPPRFSKLTPPFWQVLETIIWPFISIVSRFLTLDDLIYLETIRFGKLMSRASFWHRIFVLLIKFEIWPFLAIFSRFLTSDELEWPYN